MDRQFEKYKGIHPGFVLERELKKRSIKQRPFALSIAEHPQSFNAIIKGKRSLSTALALKIEKGLDLDEGTFVMLQAYYDIKKEKEKQLKLTPNLRILRKSLFWDTDVDRIDWEKQAKAVIERVFERGNNDEKEEMTRFYGQAKIQSVLAG
ncbi:plasmid maintenance system antidote protein [Dyadobacter chenwenxiniae]|uniref:Plasmid maintenance system antidote protein n=1 Tax=Dyadobacter chenwenxiniae TaxID=2906456 RepID=A0A9X1PKU9_9BACT|nr:plasmid maintenance system antidote protein [Dyadobacter chenwenxiniae]MCF0061814.1 plasmid maintenance system antidote protein [Dyadobacter chenwenxiniae]UON81629.1 plasmid maintenance system antidote protein [Dyadobacter chenwenxiniae]